MRRLALALAALLATAGCGGLLFAELEVPSVSVKLLSQSFDGTTPGSPLLKEIQFDVAEQLPSISDPNVTYELRLEGLHIHLTSDLSGDPVAADFSAIEEVRVEVIHPDGTTLPDYEVVHYRRPAGATGPLTEVTAGGRTNIDLGPYILAGMLRLRATATGGLPSSPWTADVTGDFYLKIKLDYGAYLQTGSSGV